MSVAIDFEKSLLELLTIVEKGNSSSNNIPVNANIFKPLEDGNNIKVYSEENPKQCEKIAENGNSETNDKIEQQNAENKTINHVAVCKKIVPDVIVTDHIEDLGRSEVKIAPAVSLFVGICMGVGLASHALIVQWN